jgi:hypothetical protein
VIGSGNRFFTTYLLTAENGIPQLIILNCSGRLIPTIGSIAAKLFLILAKLASRYLSFKLLKLIFGISSMGKEDLITDITSGPC